MAVEASRIKGRFKELFPKANLSNKRLDAIAARLAKKPADDAEDSAIDEVLNDANDVYPFEEMAKDEHRLTNAENKLRQQKPTGPADDQDPPGSADDQNPPTNDEVPAWAKTLIETNNSLKADLQELKTGKIIESKKANAKKLFDNNDTLKGLKESVKEKWFNRIDVNSETPVEEQITDLEAEYTEIVQINADNKRTAGAPPAGSNGGDKPTDTELDAIVGNL